MTVRCNLLDFGEQKLRFLLPDKGESSSQKFKDFVSLEETRNEDSRTAKGLNVTHGAKNDLVPGNVALTNNSADCDRDR